MNDKTNRTRPGNGAYACECGGCFDAVMDSRPSSVDEGKIVIRRRRRCSACGKRMSTYEVPMEEYVNVARLYKERMAKIMVEVFKQVTAEMEKDIEIRDPD